MTYIFDSSASLDMCANGLEAWATTLREQAKQIRWVSAPDWANCIVYPSKSGIHEIQYRRAIIDEHPEYAVCPPPTTW